MKEINAKNLSRVKFRKLQRHRMTGKNTIATTINNYWLVRAENFIWEL